MNGVLTQVVNGENDNTETELILRGKNFEESQSICFLLGSNIQTHVIWGRYRGEDGDLHEGYGIQVENRFEVIRRIPDITTDAFALSQLVERMNRLKVSLYHVDDVVQDFILA